ncbi:MAG: hypothetical protein LBB85_05635 [Dysgonamonadaceae bacterium]|jgi:hypothetical protein|nr:hypothetical protein [Dysgonamonadaceae bacterium]
MLDKELLINKYIALMATFDEAGNLGGEGSWIVLEVNPADYVLSQIAHLVEQNNAQALHVFSYLEEETAKQIVLLKIDLKDASPVVRSLQRFDYVVRYSSGAQGMADETMRNRINELIYYLEL